MAKKRKKARARLVLFVPACCVVVIAICTAVGNYWVQIAEKYKEKSELSEFEFSLKRENSLYNAKNILGGTNLKSFEIIKKGGRHYGEGYYIKKDLYCNAFQIANAIYKEKGNN